MTTPGLKIPGLKIPGLKSPNPNPNPKNPGLKIPGLLEAITSVENSTVLDPAIGTVQKLVNRIVRPQALRDLLHGVPAGHPLHPALVLVPTGAWLSAAVLDVLPGNDRAARTLVGVGILGALPSSLSGWTDWSELHEQQLRVGAVHSIGNLTATVLYAASFVQRSRKRPVSGRVLGYLGLAALGAAGFLGGHLAYRQAAGANHAEDVPHLFPRGWQPLGRLDELPDGALTSFIVADLPLLVLRRGSSVEVLSNTCSHLSAPLDEGTLLNADGADPCVQCPWHASVFSLTTGEVVHGPATAPQPKFLSRVVDGSVEVMLPGAG